MTCARCGAETETETMPTASRWCQACEATFDGWARQYATDLVWQVLAGMLLVVGIGVGLPLLGATRLVAVAGVFAGFGTFAGLHRLNRRRRRRQFLTANVPRAYLPTRS